MSRYALIATSLAAICGCSPTKTSVPLNADVSVSGLDFKIVNHDQFDWSDCILRVNIISVKEPGYRLDVRSIRSGTTATLDALEFTAGINGEGERFRGIVDLNMGITCGTPNGQATYVKIFR